LLFSASNFGIYSSVPLSSSSMLKPSLIILCILAANDTGSSKLKPDVNKAVSNNNQIKSLTVLSDLSLSLFFLIQQQLDDLG